MPVPVLHNIEKSAEANALSPPVADALGTCFRRRAAGADGYELTSRLIHVWEAVASILSGVEDAVLSYYLVRHPAIAVPL